MHFKSNEEDVPIKETENSSSRPKSTPAIFVEDKDWLKPLFIKPYFKSNDEPFPFLKVSASENAHEYEFVGRGFVYADIRFKVRLSSTDVYLEGETNGKYEYLSGTTGSHTMTLRYSMYKMTSADGLISEDEVEYVEFTRHPANQDKDLKSTKICTKAARISLLDSQQPLNIRPHSSPALQCFKHNRCGTSVSDRV